MEVFPSFEIIPLSHFFDFDRKSNRYPGIYQQEMIVLVSTLMNEFIANDYGNALSTYSTSVVHFCETSGVDKKKKNGRKEIENW